ncbi:MAG: hypothetical protein IH606_01555 [Burkholderiales bacterium]|nr:hypothetical protein [Burkholderiales bacterium]
MNAPLASTARLHPELLLQILDVPLSFHRCLVPISGSVTAALLLSQAICNAQGADPALDGWFSKSQDEWGEETGLTRWEQATARRLLREAGFLEEQRLGMPAKLWFRVRPERVWQALQERAGALAPR